MQQQYGIPGAHQEDLPDQRRDEQTIRRNKPKTNGSEQRETRKTGRNTLSFKSGSTSTGVKSEVKHCSK